jgi:hypothetical protein
MSHKCYYPDYGHLIQSWDVLKRPLFQEIVNLPWNPEVHRSAIHQEASEISRALVVACGLHPAVATRAGMDAEDAWFACLGCACDTPDGKSYLCRGGTVS